MQQILEVQGLHCQHCEEAVRSALKRIEGVDGVKVDLKTGKVTISYHKQGIEEHCVKVIEEVGYKVV